MMFTNRQLTDSAVSNTVIFIYLLLNVVLGEAEINVLLTQHFFIDTNFTIMCLIIKHERITTVTWEVMWESHTGTLLGFKLDQSIKFWEN